MQPTPRYTGPSTAIPPRFRQQRERVLRILTRWELTTRSAPSGSPVFRLRPTGAAPEHGADLFEEVTR